MVDCVSNQKPITKNAQKPPRFNEKLIHSTPLLDRRFTSTPHATTRVSFIFYWQKIPIFFSFNPFRKLMAVIKFYFVSPEGEHVRLIKYPAESLSFPILDWRLVVYSCIHESACMCLCVWVWVYMYSIYIFIPVIFILLFALSYLCNVQTLHRSPLLNANKANLTPLIMNPSVGGGGGSGVNHK